ncbi:MAG TPA: NUDIX domain-containing protein [Polyangiaceae bacterium]|nr:NUDIX domain-containing protein [Polyangiaceae bacterium]
MNSDALSALLSRYVPSDAREQVFRARMKELVRQPSAFDRRFFSPGHFTASAFVLSPERDAVLLVLHRKLGIWVQPGGHVDASDADVASAARREVAEETGVTELEPLLGADTLFDVDIHPIPARGIEPSHEHFDVRFAFRAARRALVESDEVSAVRWVSLPETPSVTTDRSVLRAVEKLRALVG